MHAIDVTVYAIRNKAGSLGNGKVIIIVILIILAILGILGIALGVGLGVGLSQGNLIAY